jgi:CRP-like cAMP-binding protein
LAEFFSILLDLGRPVFVREREREAGAVSRRGDDVECGAKFQRALEEQYIVRFSQDVASRIIHVLLEFARPYGLERSKAVTLPMKLSRTSLAEIVGTTPETISRVISRLKQQRHVLETHQETIIPGIERLRALIRPSA